MRSEKRKQLLLWIIAGVGVVILIPLIALLTRLWTTVSSTVTIHEILASNSAFPDNAGRYRDFIELYNGGEHDVNLSGLGLTDSGRTAKYRFPEGSVLPAGGYLVVWCDSAAEDGDGAAAFSVSKDGGETISLLSARGMVLDSVTTIPSFRNQSMIPDGGENGGWTLCEYPTPGFENTPEGYAAYLASRSEDGYPVRISEFMSSNTLYPAPDGEYYDWIELHNTGSAPVELGGWSLSDTSETAKHYFGTGETIPAGGYAAVWCGAGGAGFSLNREGGETLCLLGPEGELIDRLTTPALEKNQSFALDEDGDWTACAQATPGFPNSGEGYEAYLAAMGYGDNSVFISEVMAENRGCVQDSFGAFSDWIELYNDGAEAVDLGGWWLSDDPARPDQWQIPGLTIAPGDYAVIFCDGRNTVVQGECHTSFSLSKSGETVLLSTPLGSHADSLSYGALEADRAALASGEVTDAPSPGFANDAAGALSFLASRETPGPLAIHEVMSSNDTVLRQNDGRYYDWAELYNSSGAAVSLSGYTLTDDLSEPERFVFPDVELKPGETCVVLLTGGAEFQSNDVFCAPFALDAAEDWLYLCGPGGEVVDFVRVANLPYRGSMGRVAGEKGFFYFDTPTPGKENGTGARGITAAPVADLPPGVYDGVESVTVTLGGEGEIRYTTDGGVPTAESPLYEGPITLEKTTVIRARCFAAGLLPGDTVTLNYIINEGHTIAVACLTLAPGDFNSIYQDVRADNEVYANLTLFEEDGGSFSIDCGLKLHGAGSRIKYEKKSMKAVFRPRYAGQLEYDVFEDGEFTTFDSLTLRGGTMSDGKVMICDTVCSTVACEISDNVLSLNGRYCVLYINGRYWGIYALREAYSEKYVADHLGVREEDVRISRAYLTEQDLRDHVDALNRLDVSTREGFDAAAEWLDMESLADWMILEAWFANTDIPGNVRYIYSAADGKWRYAFFDLDNTFYDDDVSLFFVFDTGYTSGLMPKRMIQSPDFRDLLLRRMAALLDGPLSSETVGAVLEGYHVQLAPEADREYIRWGMTPRWDAAVEALMGRINAPRSAQLIEMMGNYLGLDREELDAYFGTLACYKGS